MHSVVIGTFNVESPQPRAFTDSDLQFLEIFCRDVAMSLNTLDLLDHCAAGQCGEEERERRTDSPRSGSAH